MNQSHEQPRKKPFKIHSEPVKSQHVSHWDMDYLPSEEIEAEFEQRNTESREQDSEANPES